MAVTLTVNYNFPKPDPEANVDEEFFRLQTQTLDLIDQAIKATSDLAAAKANAAHGHGITDITGLADILEHKMSANKTFALDDLTDVTGAANAANGYLLARTATGWVPLSPAAVLGSHQHSMADIVGLGQALENKVDGIAFQAQMDLVGDAIAKSVPAGAVMPFFRASAPSGWLKANGAAIFRLDYVELDSAIYVGDEHNAIAESGYRCTDPADPDGTRTIAGDYLVLPDLRAETVRGLDDGRGVDAGRKLGSWQADDIKAHDHTVDPPSATTSTDTHGHYVAGDHGGTSGSYDYGTNFDSDTRTNSVNSRANTSSDSHNHSLDIPAFDSGSTGGSETRVRNVALLYCIKY